MRCLSVPTLPRSHTAPHPPSCQVEFLPQCDKVAIMDEGTCVYFGPWTPAAQQLLSKYLPASHLLAAGGGAEQPRDTKKKPAKTESKHVSRSWEAREARRPLHAVPHAAVAAACAALRAGILLLQRADGAALLLLLPAGLH